MYIFVRPSRNAAIVERARVLCANRFRCRLEMNAIRGLWKTVPHHIQDQKNKPTNPTIVSQNGTYRQNLISPVVHCNLHRQPGRFERTFFWRKRQTEGRPSCPPHDRKHYTIRQTCRGLVARKAGFTRRQYCYDSTICVIN